ncbi:MAG: single-stranded DNA-binding protein [Bacteroidia bacterium]|nr:single-stranded DNA-binding protein [Bacteroidia bacterium]MCZ2278017.1 single-stranded DNA-binding protein [Bacteroidia bacterium]
MSGVNKVILVGNLGKDPEVRHLDSGVVVAKVVLATSEVFKKSDGTKVETKEWHNVVMWRGLAETAEKYLRKGSLIYVEGKLRTRSWEESGVRKYSTEVVADTMTMLGRKPDDATIAQVEEELKKTPSDLPANSAPIPEPGDDLPF